MRPICAVPALALALLLATLGGCGGPSEIPYALTISSFSTPWMPEEGAPLLVNGVEIGVVQSGDRIELQLPVAQRFSDGTATAALRLPSTCGSSALPLVPQGSANVEELSRRVANNSSPVSIGLGTGGGGPRIRLYVDNTGADAAAELRLGVVTATVPPGQVGDLDLLVGDCPAALALQINGEAVPWEQVRPDEGAVLIDVAGDRCYEREVLYYATAESYHAGESAQPPAPVRYENARVQIVPRTNHLFTLPPQSLQSTGPDTRSALRHVPCPGATLPAAARSAAPASASGASRGSKVTPSGARPGPPPPPRGRQ